MSVGGVEREIRRVARSQGGAISWRQLRRLGLTADEIRVRVAQDRLIRVFRGVYLVADPALLRFGREAAALLLLGPSSVLSHRSAVAAWGLATPHPETIDVTVIDSNPRPRTGIRIHHVARLDPRDVDTDSNLRLTTPSRALIEFAAQATSSELEHSFGEARAKHLINDRKLEQALQRAPANHPGAAILRHLLASEPATTYTRSKAERTVRRLLAAADVTQPKSNVPLLGYTADFLWEGHKLILEVDGYGTHGNRIAFERDRKRDQVHVAAGYTVIRVTWQQLLHEPYAVIARIAQALALRAAG